MTDKDKRAEVEERMAEILDGDAPQELYDHIADSDECRDARYESEQAVSVAREAAADYVEPKDLEERVMAAVDGRTDGEATDGPRTQPMGTVSQVAAAEQTKPADDGTRARPLADDAPPAAEPKAEAAVETAAEQPEAEAEQAEAEGPPIADPHAQPAEARDKSGLAKVIDLASRRKAKLGIAGALAAAAAAAAFVFALRTGELESETPIAEAWSAKVAHISNAAGTKGGLEICDPQGESCHEVSQGGSVPEGSLLRTDGRTRVHLQLNDGTELSLDRGTELAFVGDEDRQAKLSQGTIVADVTHVEDSRARFEIPTGSVEVLGTKFALQTTRDSTAVNVSRGAVKLADHQQRSVTVRAGEEGRLYAGMPPYASSAVALGEALGWSESAQQVQEEEIAARGLGELRAKKPGSKQEVKEAVTLTSHSVKVRISGAVARTEVDETFTNHTSDVLEGIYRFPLPPDAKIERLALEVNGKLEEGAFVDRDRAAAIWRGAIVQAAPKLRREMREEIVWVPGPWKDPALLEWQRGGRFELRIYPIPKNGARRVVLAYTQVIKPSGGVRRYTYPLAHDPSGSTKVDRFDVDFQVRGHDGSFGVRSHGYGLSRDGSTPQVEKLKLAEKQFVPNGDLTIEYALPNRNAELTAWAYQPTGEEKAKAASDKKSDDEKTSAVGEGNPYVAVALRPRLPRVAVNEHRNFVLVVDSSRSMFGESYRRAAQLATRVVREMDRLDQFTVLACDTTCRALPGGLQTPSPQAAAETKRFLDGIQPDGGSDVTETIRNASSAANSDGSRALRVVYIGDGTPTVGPIRPAYVTRAVKDALPAGRSMVTTVAIGADSDLDTLRAVARGGGGVVLPYIPGQTTAEAAYAVLGAAYGTSLRDVAVKLPEGLVEVAPRRVDTIPAGGESIIVARMTRPEVSGTVKLEGKVGKETFEQRYPVKLVASRSQGNAFVPRLYAATRIADLEQDPDAKAKEEAIKLSSAFNVASRHTSLLVLESPAMFKAFGLDNTRRAPEWTGEEEAEATLADGEFEMDDGSAAVGVGGADIARSRRPKKSSAGGRVDFGSGAGWSGTSASLGGAPRPAAAPRPKPAAPRPPSPASAPIALEDAFEMEPPRPPRRPPRRMIPMRRVWDRKGSVATSSTAPKAASMSKIVEAERELERNSNRREAVKKLYTLYALAGDVDKARPLAERWSEKEPLDPEALTARADLAARSGDRELAIRILGSVVDVRPGDIKSQKRLARLHRWASRPALGCRHSIAIAQLRTKESKLLAEAVRCGRKTGEGYMVDDMLSAAEDKVRKAAEALIAKAKDDEDKLRGDFRLEATWSSGGHDLDLALLHPDGHRVSWLGAPTRSVITATDVESESREGLALRGGKPGEYVIEVVRAKGAGPVSGSVTVTVAGTKKTIPFTLEGNRVTLGIAKVRMQSRLVPLNRPWR